MASKAVYRPLRDPFVFLFGGLSFFGLFDALLLTAEHYMSLTLPCSFSGGCEQVLTSRFSTIFGLPISLLGVVFYGLIFFLVVVSVFNADRLPRLFLLGWGAIGFVTSLVLVGLQAFVVRAWCQYCLLSAVTSTLLFITAIILYRQRSLNISQEETVHEEA